MFPISTQAGDKVKGWYGGRTITRVLAEGSLVVARYRFNDGYTAGAFYSLRDYPLGDVVTGDYPLKVTIDISSVGIGYSTLYAYGGMNGAGMNGEVTMVIDGMPIYLTTPPTVGADVPSGPVNQANFGTAFDSMLTKLKEQFWTSVLQTI